MQYIIRQFRLVDAWCLTPKPVVKALTSDWLDH